MLLRFFLHLLALDLLSVFSAAALLPKSQSSSTTAHVVDSSRVSSGNPAFSELDQNGQKVDNAVIDGSRTVSTDNRLAKSVSNVRSTVLILARDMNSAYSVSSGLNGYGIPHEVRVVPKTGILLPILNESDSQGNYGAIFVVSDVTYDYGGTLGFQSAITGAQWTAIFDYQVNFGVRLVRLDVFPSAEFGTTTSSGGCCDNGIEQMISISDTSLFPTAGLKTNAGVSTKGLWHYPATISNSSFTTEFAQFAPSRSYPNVTTAGVINSFPGRQQMAWFLGFSTEWSATSNFLQHASIHWATRGLYLGYRRLNLNTQVDDVFLVSDIYSPPGETLQIVPSDLEQHVSWTATVNERLSNGSNWFIELGHNGNGNIETAVDVGNASCGIGPIEYNEQIDTPLEWAKPPGTGVDLWPSTPADFPYGTECTNVDALRMWFSNPDNLNAFAHVSHTFTHEDQNNATYHDVFQEISWNKAWLKQVGIDSATKFSDRGIIPPAITGLHNADALKAWLDNGIVNVVGEFYENLSLACFFIDHTYLGDNTRPVLLNHVNEMWPLITTVADNGYDGVVIVPRWATNIFYNCNLPDCTVLEWINTSTGRGDFDTLLAVERETNIRNLFGLHRDPFMFHQANLDYGNAEEITINGVTQKLSLFQAWVETMIQEITRLVTWPVLSLKHDDIATAFIDRMTRDLCQPLLSWNTDPNSSTITGITLTANNNMCNAKIPVTVPVDVTDLHGFTTEQIGSDPLTIWASLSGSAVSFDFVKPISI
ncbi:putative extracellular serine-rich protein [Golovinomyces cichoracearum]|uniref:Putative extracellular serine-rich protein n=1 Tax=Golovinomyces cichoracearum TaxID=62708 RepID=A0A420J6Z5_9PEZI|nr:putative extracellular serine-rich protein [Golovinomyces cichoracearum]